jgi:hypothetical protein
MADWLEEFVDYASYGEASPRLMYWVGVSTIAAALRRKVWFDQKHYQWSPNFYILVVGPPGTVRKSTSIDIGMQLLKEVPDINFGPSIVTWQALVQYIAEIKEQTDITDSDGVVTEFEMSCVTLAISEFGTFFDPENRELVDVLTDLWDGKLGTIDKMTKTSGSDSMVNSWVNIIAGTTPKWLAKNFGENLVGGGLAGRFIFLYGEMPTKDVAYPKRQMPIEAKYRLQRAHLIAKLTEISKLSGEVELTEAAYEWGEVWYAKERATLRAIGTDSLESGFLVRKQVHLHKLAMVISAARYKLPLVDVAEMEEAERQLSALDVDTQKVFGYVGQNRVTTAAREIVEAVEKFGAIERRMLYRRQFFRTMSSNEFNEAIQSALQAELIIESDGVAKPVLMPRRA